MEVSGQRHAPTSLPPINNYQVSLVEEAGWAPETIWGVFFFFRKEKPVASTGIQTPDRPARSVVITPIELRRSLSRHLQVF